MVIVAGHLVVEAARRDEYVAACVEVVEQARRAPGCLDFAVTADSLDPKRVNVFERWQTQEAVEAFRGDGTGDDLSALIHGASVAEYDVAAERWLT